MRTSLKPLPPRQPFQRAGAGAVFAADKTVITQRVDPAEKVEIIELAGARLGPSGHRSDLDMADDGHQPFQPLAHITMNDLAVIDVELEGQIGQSQRADKVCRRI